MRTSSADTRPSRWGMLRDLVVFQGKLLVDGLRDAVLLPVSLIAGLVDLAVGGAHPGERFYAVVAWGRRSERWINLFGSADHLAAAQPSEQETSLDNFVARFETVLREQHQKGGVTASAKRVIDKALDTVQRKPPGDGTGEGT